MDQSLYGDEIFAFHETSDGVAGIFDALGDRGEEVSPPLFFLLAEKARQLGDPTVWIRLPSLVLGTATVPIVYFLGRRVYHEAAGMIAAALVALSPFAIFYSTEARPYATLACLVALSTLALVSALERPGWGWWLVYVLSASGAMYTHYTAVFALGAQTAWALWFHRERLGLLVGVNAALALTFLPWIPTLSEQLGKEGNLATLAGSVDSAGDYPDFVVRLLTGHPFKELGSIPGAFSLAALALVATVVAGSLLLRGPVGAGSAKSWLIPILALATPVGLALYGAFSSEIYNPRNLIASMPALAVLAGWAIGSLRRPLAVAAVALALLGIGLGAGRSLSDRYQRPAVREIAAYIDRHAQKGDVVLAPGIEELPFPGLSIYFERDHEVVSSPEEIERAWRRVAAGGGLFQVQGDLGLSLGLLPLAGPGRRFPLRDGRTFDGLVEFGVGRYQGELTGTIERARGRRWIRWSLGRVPIQPAVAEGFVDAVEVSDGAVEVVGWAIDPNAKQRADEVILFGGGRLLGLGRPALRPDVAETHGRATLPAGFTINAPSGRDPLQVFAVVDGRAARLPLTPAARQER